MQDLQFCVDCANFFSNLETFVFIEMYDSCQKDIESKYSSTFLPLTPLNPFGRCGEGDVCEFL